MQKPANRALQICNGLCPGSVWKFDLISSETARKINATLTIDAIVNAELVSIDNESAKDQSGANLQSLLVPVIKPDNTLKGIDRSGYVQFTIRFFRNGIHDGYSVLTNLSGLRLSVYDIEGNDAGNINSGNSGSWFRESAFLHKPASDNPALLLDQATEISNAGFAEAGENWVGGIGALCERNDISGCSQSTIAGQFETPQYGVSFRIGYNYNAG
jgi:hypothetical protein